MLHYTSLLTQIQALWYNVLMSDFNDVQTALTETLQAQDRTISALIDSLERLRASNDLIISEIAKLCGEIQESKADYEASVDEDREQQEQDS